MHYILQRKIANTFIWSRAYLLLFCEWISLCSYLFLCIKEWEKVVLFRLCYPLCHTILFFIGRNFGQYWFRLRRFIYVLCVFYWPKFRTILVSAASVYLCAFVFFFIGRNFGQYCFRLRRYIYVMCVFIGRNFGQYWFRLRRFLYGDLCCFFFVCFFVCSHYNFSQLTSILTKLTG